MKGSCPLCGLTDSTEHIFTCDKIDNNKNITVNNLKKGEKMKEIINAFCRAEELRNKAITDFVNQEIDAYPNPAMLVQAATATRM